MAQYIRNVFHYGSWVEGRDKRGRRILVPTEKGIKSWKMLVQIEEQLYRSTAKHYSTSAFGMEDTEAATLMSASNKKFHAPAPDRLYGRSVVRNAENAGRGGTVLGQAAAHQRRGGNART